MTSLILLCVYADEPRPYIAVVNYTMASFQICLTTAIPKSRARRASHSFDLSLPALHGVQVISAEEL
jgi:hypothetical protein